MWAVLPELELRLALPENTAVRAHVLPGVLKRDAIAE